MITNEQIKNIIDDCSKEGYNISTRDISYVFLCRVYSDKRTVYKILFGKDKNFNLDYVDTYHQTNAITYLNTYIDINYSNKEQESKKKSKKPKNEKDISFEENKAEIIKLIEDTKKALEEGEIEAKDALKIQADLRVKLNDKFNVAEDVAEQLVIVNCKFNNICSGCGREIYIPTKEDLIEKYNLIENNK